MKTFTIDNETNAITAHATVQNAVPISGTQHSRSEAELAELAATWSTARLIAIWNSLPGVTPLKRFQNRNTGITRIWKAIQKSGGAGQLQGVLQAGLDVSATIREPEAFPPSPESELEGHVAPPGEQLTSPTTRKPLLGFCCWIGFV